MTGHVCLPEKLFKKYVQLDSFLYDAKINKTTPTQLDVIRLYCCWFTNLKKLTKGRDWMLPVPLLLFCFCKYTTPGNNRLLKFMNKHPYRDWSFLVL